MIFTYIKFSAQHFQCERLGEIFIYITYNFLYKPLVLSVLFRLICTYAVYKYIYQPAGRRIVLFLPGIYQPYDNLPEKNQLFPAKTYPAPAS